MRRPFLRPLALAIAALTTAFAGTGQQAAANAAVGLRREEAGIRPGLAPEMFVLARNSHMSGANFGHSSHSSHASHRSHASHSSHYSGSTPSDPYPASPPTYAPAPAPVYTPAPTFTTAPAPSVKRRATSAWFSLTVVHVEELSPFHHQIELSDGHVYSVANKVVPWTPGDPVQVHAESSAASARKYFTLKGADGLKFEARRVK